MSIKVKLPRKLAICIKAISVFKNVRTCISYKKVNDQILQFTFINYNSMLLIDHFIQICFVIACMSLFCENEYGSLYRYTI